MRSASLDQRIERRNLAVGNRGGSCADLCNGILTVEKLDFPLQASINQSISNPSSSTTASSLADPRESQSRNIQQQQANPQQSNPQQSNLQQSKLLMMNRIRNPAVSMSSHYPPIATKPNRVVRKKSRIIAGAESQIEWKTPTDIQDNGRGGICNSEASRRTSSFSQITRASSSSSSQPLETIGCISVLQTSSHVPTSCSSKLPTRTTGTSYQQTSTDNQHRNTKIISSESTASRVYQSLSPPKHYNSRSSGGAKRQDPYNSRLYDHSPSSLTQTHNHPQSQNQNNPRNYIVRDCRQSDVKTIVDGCKLKNEHGNFGNEFSGGFKPINCHRYIERGERNSSESIEYDDDDDAGDDDDDDDENARHRDMQQHLQHQERQFSPHFEQAAEMKLKQSGCSVSQKFSHHNLGGLNREDVQIYYTKNFCKREKPQNSYDDQLRENLIEELTQNIEEKEKKDLKILKEFKSFPMGRQELNINNNKHQNSLKFLPSPNLPNYRRSNSMLNIDKGECEYSVYSRLLAEIKDLKTSLAYDKICAASKLAACTKRYELRVEQIGKILTDSIRYYQRTRATSVLEEGINNAIQELKNAKRETNYYSYHQEHRHKAFDIKEGESLKNFSQSSLSNSCRIDNSLRSDRSLARTSSPFFSQRCKVNISPTHSLIEVNNRNHSFNKLSLSNSDSSKSNEDFYNAELNSNNNVKLYQQPSPSTSAPHTATTLLTTTAATNRDANFMSDATDITEKKDGRINSVKNASSSDDSKDYSLSSVCCTNSNQSREAKKVQNLDLTEINRCSDSCSNSSSEDSQWRCNKKQQRNGRRCLIPTLKLKENKVSPGSWLGGELTQGDTYVSS